MLHAFLSSQAFLFRHIRRSIEPDLKENCGETRTTWRKMCQRVDFMSIKIRGRTCRSESEAATCTTRPVIELSCACILLPLRQRARGAAAPAEGPLSELPVGGAHLRCSGHGLGRSATFRVVRREMRASNRDIPVIIISEQACPDDIDGCASWPLRGDRDSQHC